MALSKLTGSKLTGLIAAACTPMQSDGQLWLSQIPPLVEHLLASGVEGFYVCGSTGEGISLSREEREQVTEAYVRAIGGRKPVVVQVGHNSLAEAKRLAGHAASVGADSISATCPSYFKVGSEEMLTDCMEEVAAGAPSLPFYYYHIPALTGSPLNMVRFLDLAKDRIGNLVGLKYTDTKLHEFQQCLAYKRGRFDVVWGCDEMMLGALASGATGAIGSTYNIAAPTYLRLMKRFEGGDWTGAREEQLRSIAMIDVMKRYPFHAALKCVLKQLGHDMGRCRPPQESLTAGQEDQLRADLDAIGFFEWL